MEFKTKSGKKVSFKDISIDDKDMLLDSVEYEMKEDGSVGNVRMLNTTMTKWIRTCIDGDSSDKFLVAVVAAKNITLLSSSNAFINLLKNP